VGLACIDGLAISGTVKWSVRQPATPPPPPPPPPRGLMDIYPGRNRQCMDDPRPECESGAARDASTGLWPADHHAVRHQAAG